MSIFKAVTEGLKIELVAKEHDGELNWNHVNNFIPKGWHSIAKEMFFYCENRGDASVIGIHVERGKLIFTTKELCISPYKFAERVAHGLAGESSRTCMITGNRGRRRKDVDGWPCLDDPTYIQFLNEAYENHGIRYGHAGRSK